MEKELVKHYPGFYALTGVGASHRHVLLDTFIPSLLHLKAVALLDHAFVEHMTTHALFPNAKKYRNTLGGRIQFLSDEGFVANGEALTEINQRRNDAAHTYLTNHGWDVLESDCRAIKDALQQLGVLTIEQSKLEYFGERSAMRTSSKPGCSFERDFVVGIKEDGKVAVDYRWSELMSSPAPTE